MINNLMSDKNQDPVHGHETTFQESCDTWLMIYQLFPVLPLPIVVPREGKTGKIGCSSQEMIIHKSSWDDRSNI